MHIFWKRFTPAHDSSRSSFKTSLCQFNQLRVQFFNRINLMLIKRIINFLVIFHFTWSLFLISGFIGIFFTDSTFYLRAYTFVIIITFLAQLIFRGCPLTQLEDYLHHKLTGEKKYRTMKCLTYYTKRFFGIEIADIYMTVLSIVFFSLVFVLILIK